MWVCPSVNEYSRVGMTTAGNMLGPWTTLGDFQSRSFPSCSFPRCIKWKFKFYGCVLVTTSSAVRQTPRRPGTRGTDSWLDDTDKFWSRFAFTV